MRKVRILNTELIAATQKELLDELRQGVVVTPNIDHLVKLQKDKELYESATKIWQKLYLEWFYRFCKEPRRLFKRYFIDDMKFFWYFGKQLMGIYHDPFEKKKQ